jgi:hypothetical protein
MDGHTGCLLFSQICELVTKPLKEIKIGEFDVVVDQVELFHSTEYPFYPSIDLWSFDE